MAEPARKFLFVMASARQNGNSEILARRAAEEISEKGEQTWVRLRDVNLPPFEDLRHTEGGIYRMPIGQQRVLLDATLAATDLVFVAPVYWFGLPASAKLFLDHWSGWMRVDGVNFKSRMAGKTMWAISAYAGASSQVADPLLGTLRLCCDYLRMRWGGEVLGCGSAPGDVLKDSLALANAARLFG